MFDSGVLVPFILHYEETKDLSPGDIIHSVVAYAGGHRWRIRCYPHGKKKANKQGEYISIFLELMSKSKGIKAIFEAIDFGTALPTAKLFRFENHWPDGRAGPGPGLGFLRRAWLGLARGMARYNVESQSVVNGWVTIVYGVIVVQGDSIAVPSTDVGDHLGRLLDCGDGCDVSFVVDGEDFPAHRASTMSRVPLEDIDPATFKVFLRFVYTDALPGDDELDDSATQMYERLLAVANSCSELKNKCIAFFAEEKNFREAVLTDGFVGLVQKFPSIISELREKQAKN
ncbi:hypothetical protein VPH35_122895 [Triticum aestivum]